MERGVDSVIVMLYLCNIFAIFSGKNSSQNSADCRNGWNGEQPFLLVRSGSAIASYACQYVGIPYVWGGTSLTSGVDCSGFTMAVFSAFGISLPHYAASQYGCGTPVSLSDLSAGDLVFYNGSSGAIEHVAIYVGGGSIVHARGTGYGVCYSSLYYDTPDAACRIV